MPARRGRRVPEAAPLVGVTLAFAVAVFGYLFAPAGGLLPVLLLAVVLLYGFTAYAVVRSDDPAFVLFPDAVLAGAFLLAVFLGGYGLAVAGRPMFGVFAAQVAFLPAAMYHARYGERVNPVGPETTLRIAVGVGALLLVVGATVVDDPVVATLDAVLLVLAAADYRDARGSALDDLAEFALVSVCLGGAALAVVYFVLVDGRAATGVLVAAALVVVGAYFVMGRPVDG